MSDNKIPTDRKPVTKSSLKVRTVNKIRVNTVQPKHVADPLKLFKPVRLTIPADRHERLQYMRRMFPEAAGLNLRDEFVGGRREALKRLEALDARRYDSNRNFLNGSVSHLSPYLRHGCISMKEVYDFVMKKFGSEAQRFIMQLAWRDFWQHVWAKHGDAIFSDMEPAKVKLSHHSLPDDIKLAHTGLPCMDGIIQDLLNDGYVHNHARMWFASYAIHWRGIDWREAADWFEAHLLDGDLASNHLSWQWIASTFSNKPYYFNKENLSRYTGEKYCANCQVICPFNDSYEALNTKLFDEISPPEQRTYPTIKMVRQTPMSVTAKAVFVHDEMLSPNNPILGEMLHRIFIFDPAFHGKWSLNRLQFVADCLAEMPDIEVWKGETRETLQRRGVGQAISEFTPNRALKATLLPFATNWFPKEKLITVEISSRRLERFSRFWQKVGPTLLGEQADGRINHAP